MKSVSRFKFMIKSSSLRAKLAHLSFSVKNTFGYYD